MNDRWWVAALTYPAPLYVGGAVLAHFGVGEGAFPLGFLLSVAFGSLTGFGVLRSPRVVWGGRLLLLVLMVMPIAANAWESGPVADLSAGALLGAPFLWIEYAWRDSETPGARVVALQAALFSGVLALASLGTVPSAGGLSVGGQFVDCLGRALGAQDLGIASLLTSAAPNSLPLESTLDVVFVAFGGLALAAIVASWVVPRTALGEPLPWSWVGPRRPSRLPPSPADELPLRPGQREALASRTVPTPPERMAAAGFPSIVISALLVIGFVALAELAPTVALLVLVLGILGALGAVSAILHRRLVPLGHLGT